MLEDVAKYAASFLPELCQKEDIHLISNLLEQKTIAIERNLFVRVYGLCTLLLEQALVFPDRKSLNRDKALHAFLSYVLIADNLEEACRRMTDFNMFLEERGYAFSIAVSAGLANFTIAIGPSTRNPPASLVVAIALFHFNLLSWLRGRRIPLTGVSFPLFVKGDQNPGIRLFNAPVFYEGSQTSFTFSADLLTQPLLRTKQELEADASFIAYDPLLFAGERETNGMTSLVRGSLQGSVEKGHPLPDSSMVAQQLGVSPATVFRQLKQEGTSFLSLKQDVQQDLAFALLAEDRLSIAEIAERAGFRTSRSFRRAFASWAGMAPSAYRKKN